MSALSYILQHKIVAIVRGMHPKDTVSIVNALYEGGIRLAEITLNSNNALEVIEELCGLFKNKMLIGAGTVLNAHEANNAIAAGAQFIISPSLDPEVITATKIAGIVSIPCAFTPTEIVNAHKAGADIVKVFPVPAPAYIKDVLAPLNHIMLMPTGGVKVENIQDYLAAGSVAFGIGSTLVSSKDAVNAAYLKSFTEKARSLIKALQEVNSNDENREL